MLSLNRDEPNEFKKYRSTTVRFYLLYDPKTTFKSRLETAWNDALMLPYNYMRNHYGRHYIALSKFVNH